MTRTPGRYDLMLWAAVLVLLGTSVAISVGLLSPLAGGTLFGAAIGTVIVSLGRRSRRN